MELHISESNKKNVACFLHSTNMHQRGTSILENILERMKNTNFFDFVDFVFINNIGMQIDNNKYENISKKIVLFNYSFDVNLFENCTIKTMSSFCKLNPQYKILYLHTKGVSYENNNRNVSIFENIKDWTDFMSYCLIDNAESCIDLLDCYNAIGCNYREPPKEKYEHFSGNFWWANANHINKLPVSELIVKHDAEWYLFKKRTKYLNIHTCPYGHYENKYKLEQYKNVVDENFKYFKNSKKYEVNNLIFLNYSENKDMYYSNILCFINTIVDIVVDIIKKGDSNLSNVLIVTNNFLKQYFNFNDLNRKLKQYNIKIVSNFDLELKVTSVKYGVNICDNTMIDITDKVIHTCYSNNKLFIDKNINLNDLAGEDPLEKVAKKLYVYYEIDGYIFHKVVDEMGMFLTNSILIDLNALEIDKNDYLDNINHNKDAVLFGKISSELKLTDSIFNKR
jgi:hypothetical protein